MSSSASTAQTGYLAAPGTTERLLDELAVLESRIGDEALDAARILAEDFLGVAVAGSQNAEGRVIHDYAVATGARGPSSVPGRHDTFGAATAALVTGTSGYSIGLTDTHAMSITHPGPSVVSAALAVAQATDSTGDRFLRAIVLGCEAVVRIGAVVNPSHRARGFHPTATCNVFGVVIAAGYLIGLDRDQLADALGIAGSMSGGLYEFRHEGSMLMAFHGGWPAHSGITAVELARRGFTGPHTVLEGTEGFFRGFSDDIHPELLAVDPDRPGIREVGLRPYNACRYGHAGIDAFRILSERRGGISPDEIASLVVFTHKTAVDQETEPSSVVGARLSTKFTVAYAVAHGPKLTEVTAADLADPLVAGLIARTEVVEDPALSAIFPEKWACRLQVTLNDGTQLTEQVDTPKGEPSNPMTAAEVSEKFRRLTSPVLGSAASMLLEEEFLSLRQAPDLTRLGRLLAGALS